MKVHRVVLMIVDSDGVGESGVREVIENARYPNDCIAPSVMRIDTKDVEWSDDHPLNKVRTCRAEFERLFST